jgi:hypothetical protein
VSECHAWGVGVSETYINRQIVVMEVLEAIGLDEQCIQHVTLCLKNLFL